MYAIEINYKAEAEIDSIAKWYDKKVPGLSFRFYDDLDATIKSISQYPSAYSYYNVQKKIRKCAALVIFLLKFFIIPMMQ
jgi:hypothetical protein